jgi:hypothetical protein
MTLTSTTLTRAAGLCAVAAGLVLIGVQTVSRWGTWALVAVLTVGTLANLASSSNWERFGWAPLVLALAVTCLRLARTHCPRP